MMGEEIKLSIALLIERSQNKNVKINRQSTSGINNEIIKIGMGIKLNKHLKPR